MIGQFCISNTICLAGTFNKADLYGNVVLLKQVSFIRGTVSGNNYLLLTRPSPLQT